MATMYMTTDRKIVNVGDIEFKLAPLTFSQRAKAETLMGDDKPLEGTVLMLRSCLKSVSGIKMSDGSEFTLTVEDGIADKDQIEALLTMPHWNTIMTTLISSLSSFDNTPVNVDFEGKKTKAKKTRGSK